MNTKMSMRDISKETKISLSSIFNTLTNAKEKIRKVADKEYKKYKSRGLGDTLEKVFQKTGIDKVAKLVLGEDCGCDTRRDRLNKLFPYKITECLNEEEYKYLDKYFSETRNSVHPQTQKTIKYL